MSARRVESHFFTATILEWKHLLKPDKYKDIIVESMRHLVQSGRVFIHGFVIMDNHIHILWHIRDGQDGSKVQQRILKYTAQQIKFDLMEHHPQVLAHFRVNASDRQYQFWERNPLTVDIWNESVLLQKLEYIHQNPVNAGLCDEAKDYHYFSAAFYNGGYDHFGFITAFEK